LADERTDIEHHIRTELTTISIASQLIGRDGRAHERHRRLAAEIVSACNRLQDCIEELLRRRDPEQPAG
jgi:signal transduction histidine kinase